MKKTPINKNHQQDWHLLTVQEVENYFSLEEDSGLTEQQVLKSLDTYGENELLDTRKRGPVLIFLRQFADFMIMVLMIAALVSGLIGELVDTIAILVILVLNAGIGAFLEYRAEKSVEALKRISPLSSRVLRQGNWINLPARDLVPGDLVELTAGSLVPADIRLLETGDLEVDESVLTGESQTVSKSNELLSGPSGTNDLTDVQIPLGDRNNMAYRGTTVSRGRALGIVVATGMNTELGQIADLLRGAEERRTPLQIRLSIFGRRLALVVLGICALIFVAGLLRGESLTLMFFTSISLAVAAIPEALPAVVTVALALGAGKMIRHHALVRQLPAVESLGSVTYICSDKTGTLTENKMYLEKVWTVSETAGQLHVIDQKDPVWQHLGRALALNNEIGTHAITSSQTLQGDPTEVALVEAAEKAGFRKLELLKEYPQLGVLAFTSERQCMTTLHQSGNRTVAYAKGSPERVLTLCRTQLSAEGEQALDHDGLQAEAATLAEAGYRVLGVAYREFDSVFTENEINTDGHQVEKNMTFLGFVGLIDPPRAEAADAIKDCLTAGITPVMITGDHPGTASAIAKRLNIINEFDGAVMTGAELKKLTDKEFFNRVKAVRVYARMSPEQKITIVNALQQQGEFVAMTGDGVNDAPALKSATIGVSMGEKGTDVAREASDIVLLDDNFATIVDAVKEGRRIFDNIRKFINYTMSSNAGEIWTILLAPFLGLPLPLLPIQILWINLVTDGLPGLALTKEKHETDIMNRPPRPPDETVFSNGVWQHILWIGFLIGGLSILSQAWAYHNGSPHWQTMVFTVLTFSQLVHSLVIRSDRESLWSQGLMSNPYLLGVVLLSVALQLSVIYLPSLQAIFHTSALPPKELAVCFALSMVVLFAVELEKYLVRRWGLYGLVPRESR